MRNLTVILSAVKDLRLRIPRSFAIFAAEDDGAAQLGIGGDFHHDRIQARLMTQFGMYSVTTPRNDASPARGQWNLDGAYRYISEAYGGYHFDKWSGVNVQAGIFMSYVGLWSYWDTQLTFDYMPSPYFSGRGGVTPPGGNTGAAGSSVPGWSPDLRKRETRVSFAMMVKL